MQERERKSAKRAPRHCLSGRGWHSLRFCEAWRTSRVPSKQRETSSGLGTRRSGGSDDGSRRSKSKGGSAVVGAEPSTAASSLRRPTPRLGSSVTSRGDRGRRNRASEGEEGLPPEHRLSLAAVAARSPIIDVGRNRSYRTRGSSRCPRPWARRCRQAGPAGSNSISRGRREEESERRGGVRRERGEQAAAAAAIDAIDDWRCCSPSSVGPARDASALSSSPDSSRGS